MTPQSKPLGSLIAMVGAGAATHYAGCHPDGTLFTKCKAESRGGEAAVTGEASDSNRPTCYRCCPPRRGKGFSS